jgi:prophage DNA circulation protein
MNRNDAKEAAGIVERMMENLVATVPASGRPGSDARTMINDTRATAFSRLMADNIGPSLDQSFDLAMKAGSTLAQIASVREQVELETPKSLGATLIRDTGIGFCLATEAMLIGNMTFTSRQDVDAVKQSLMQPFAEAEEIAADAMDAEAFMAVVSLHAAINHHLVMTALPLPRMLKYEFFEPLPSLVVAYRLYGDASRADEVRNENKIVHPAFCPPMGQALSA